MRYTKMIRDPIHDYIEITPVEQGIVDSDAFQRLRFIVQNSAAYLTYPGNVHNRFLHSLGVMHIAGELFVHSLQNARGEDLRQFLKDGKILIDLESKRLQENPENVFAAWDRVLGDASRFNHRPLRGERLTISAEDLQTVTLIWQAVRVMGLVHDLGHLPMSHVFEEAIKGLVTENELGDFNKDYEARRERLISSVSADLGEEIGRQLREIPVHEFLGVSIFDQFYPEDSDPNVKLLQKLTVGLVKKMAVVQRLPKGEHGRAQLKILVPLHKLVAGPLDADRLDYCLRDPQQSGLELGAFDLARIVKSMCLIHRDNDYQFLPTVKAMSALESFFHQRFLLYRFLIHHHNVIRMDAVLRTVLKLMISVSVGKSDDELCRLFEQFGLWIPSASPGARLLDPSCFVDITDAWLRTLMVQTLRLLNLRVAKGRDESTELSLLRLTLDTFLHRRTENLFSLWKRDADFYRDAKRVLGDCGVQEEEIDEKMKSLGRYTGVTEEFVAQLNIELQNHGVTALTDTKRQKIAEKELVVLHDDAPEPFVEISPYARSLVNVSSEIPIFHIFLIAKSIKNKNNGDFLETCRQKTLTALRKYVIKILQPDPENI